METPFPVNSGGFVGAAYSLGHFWRFKDVVSAAAGVGHEGFEILDQYRTLTYTDARRQVVVSTGRKQVKSKYRTGDIIACEKHCNNDIAKVFDLWGAAQQDPAGGLLSIANSQGWVFPIKVSVLVEYSNQDIYYDTVSPSTKVKTFSGSIKLTYKLNKSGSTITASNVIGILTHN